MKPNTTIEEKVIWIIEEGYAVFDMYQSGHIGKHLYDCVTKRTKLKESHD